MIVRTAYVRKIRHIVYVTLTGIAILNARISSRTIVQLVITIAPKDAVSDLPAAVSQAVTTIVDNCAVGYGRRTTTDSTAWIPCDYAILNYRRGGSAAHTKTIIISNHTICNYGWRQHAAANTSISTGNRQTWQHRSGTSTRIKYDNRCIGIIGIVRIIGIDNRGSNYIRIFRISAFYSHGLTRIADRLVVSPLSNDYSVTIKSSINSILDWDKRILPRESGVCSVGIDIYIPGHCPFIGAHIHIFTSHTYLTINIELTSIVRVCIWIACINTSRVRWNVEIRIEVISIRTPIVDENPGNGIDIERIVSKGNCAGCSVHVGYCSNCAVIIIFDNIIYVIQIGVGHDYGGCVTVRCGFIKELKDICKARIVTDIVHIGVTCIIAILNAAVRSSAVDQIVSIIPEDTIADSRGSIRINMYSVTVVINNSVVPHYSCWSSWAESYAVTVTIYPVILDWRRCRGRRIYSITIV